jgi:hypothetical protein
LYNSFEEGFESVKNGNERALIAIGANFTDAITQRGLDGYAADEETISMSTVKVYLDMTSELSKQMSIKIMNY